MIYQNIAHRQNTQTSLTDKSTKTSPTHNPPKHHWQTIYPNITDRHSTKTLVTDNIPKYWWQTIYQNIIGRKYTKTSLTDNPPKTSLTHNPLSHPWNTIQPQIIDTQSDHTSLTHNHPHIWHTIHPNITDRQSVQTSVTYNLPKHHWHPIYTNIPETQSTQTSVTHNLPEHHWQTFRGDCSHPMRSCSTPSRYSALLMTFSICSCSSRDSWSGRVKLPMRFVWTDQPVPSLGTNDHYQSQVKWPLHTIMHGGQNVLTIMFFFRLSALSGWCSQYCASRPLLS